MAPTEHALTRPTIFMRARHLDNRSTAVPLPLIDVGFTGDPSRCLTDNFGTYHGSDGTGAYAPDAQAAERLLTIVNPDVRTDGRFGVPQDVFSVPNELEAFKEFAHRRASSLAVASMDFATKLNVHHR